MVSRSPPEELPSTKSSLASEQSGRLLPPAHQPEQSIGVGGGTSIEAVRIEAWSDGFG